MSCPPVGVPLGAKGMYVHVNTGAFKHFQCYSKFTKGKDNSIYLWFQRVILEGNWAPKVNKERAREHLKTLVRKRNNNPSYLPMNLCFTFVPTEKAVNRGWNVKYSPQQSTRLVFFIYLNEIANSQSFLHIKEL